MKEPPPPPRSNDKKEDRLLIGIFELDEAKRLQVKFQEKNIFIELAHNQQTCTHGCRTTVEVWTDTKRIPDVIKLLKQEHLKLLDGMDFNPELLNQVFDPSKDRVTCPACGTTFTPTSKECPDCGLVFIPE